MRKKRKTKEQKIIADLRRQLSLKQTKKESLQPQNRWENTTSFSPKITKPTFAIPMATSAKSSIPSLEMDYPHLLKDLKRSGILIGLAILLQGMLYLALR